MRNAKYILLQAVLFSTLLLCGAPPAPQTLYLGNRVSIDLTARIEENSAFLKSLLRRTDEIFKKPSHTRVQRKYLTIHPNSAVFRFSAKKNKWSLWIPGNAGRWRSDAPLRKKLYLVLWSAFCGFAPPQPDTQLPDWFAAGCDEMLLREEGPEKLIRNNRRFPAAAALLNARLPLPDFRRLTEMRTEELSPAEYAWYREFSRLLLLILREDKLAFSVLQDCLTTYGQRPWYRIYESRTGSADLAHFLQAKAARIVRSDLAPASAKWLLQETAVWQELEYPELDRQGRPTGETLTAKLADLPELCRTRPDAAMLRKALSAKVNSFAGNASFDVKLLCGKMSLAAQRFGEEEQALDDFLALQQELMRLLKQKQAEEERLAAEAGKHLPPLRSFPVRFRELQGGRNALSPGEQQLLREREKLYKAE